MKLIELATKSIAFNLYRGITGELADIARTGQPIPQAERGSNFWIYGPVDEPFLKTLHNYDMDQQSNYAEPDGVIIKTTLIVPFQDGTYVFPPNWATCGDEYTWDDDSECETTTTNLNGYIVSKGPTTSYEIVHDMLSQ